MMLFSEKMFDEGMRILEANNFKSSSSRESSLNWRLLKGFELSGNMKSCLEFAKDLAEQADSTAPLLHSLSIDALISASCKMKQPNEVIRFYHMAVDAGLHLETSSIDRLVKFLVNSDDWKSVYNQMLSKPREAVDLHVAGRSLYLLWKARSYFYDGAVQLILERYFRKDGQFFYMEGKTIRSTMI